MADVQIVTVTLSDGTQVQVVAGTQLHAWYLALAARTSTVSAASPDIDLTTLRPMAWFMTPHGPQSVIEPATIAEFRRRDYAELTAQQAADFFANAVEIPDVSFVTGQELPGAMAAAAADDESPFAVGLKQSFAPVTAVHPAGHRLVALGDSITITGDTLEGTNPYVMRSDSIWQTAASLSNGALKFVRNAGVGGNTAAQMLARFDADVTPYQPTVVTLMAGTNDFTFGVTDATYRANMQALVAKVRSIGAVPVLFTPLPVNSFSDFDRAKILRNGRWLKQYAATQGLVCIDAFALVVDPATSGAYRAGYDQGDGIHPSVTARIAIGQALWNALAPLLPSGGPVGASCDLDPTNLIPGNRHPLFLGGSSGGFPLGWFAGESPSAGSGSNSIVDDAQMPGGKALRLTMTGMTGQYSIRTDITSGFAPGDHMHMSCLVNQPVAGAGAKLLATYNIDALHWVQTSLTGRYALEMEFIAPAGADAILLNLVAIGDGSTGSVDFGGVAIRNLTAENSASPV